MARALVKEIKDTRKNYIINGDMSIAQRGTSFVAALDNTYTVDRWIYKKTAATVNNANSNGNVLGVTANASETRVKAVVVNHFIKINP